MPSLPPPMWAELHYTGTWSDVSLLAEKGFTATRGRGAERDSAGPSTGAMTLVNTGGRYSRRSPASPLWGQAGLNTPIRYGYQGAGSVWAESAGTLTSYLSTPTSPAYDLTGDLDVRAEIAADSWTRDIAHIANRWGAGAAGWALRTSSTGVPQMFWSPDGTASVSVPARAYLPAHAGQRIVLRVTVDIANADGRWEVRFYTGLDAGATDPSAWRLLGTPVTGTAPTSINNPPEPLCFGALRPSVTPGMPGRLYRLQLRQGINGPVLADTDTSRASVGATSYTDPGGAVWTLNGDMMFTDRHVRLHGEVPDWTPQRDKSGALRTLQIAPAGITRRLSSGEQRLRSPLFREMSSPAREAIVAYWPCEDSSAALAVASGLPNHPAGTVRGAVSMAANSAAWLASDPLPTFARGRLDFTVTKYADTGQVSFRWLLAVPAAGVSATVHLMRATMTGTAAQLDVWVTPAGSLRVAAFDADGTALSDTTTAFAVNGITVAITLELSLSGTTATYTCITTRFVPGLTVDDPLATSSGGGTFTAAAVGRCTRISLGSVVGDLGGTIMGHLAISTDLAGYAGTADANLGWNGELARSRLLRLAAEEQVPLSVAMDGTRQPRLGVQKSNSFLKLLEEVERTDMGVLVERRDAPELVYRSSSSLTNQEPVLVLDHADGLFDDLRPRDDDKAPFNVLTAKRIDGSEYTYELLDGPQSVQPPPDGIGRKSTSVDLSLSSDQDLPSQAGWRVHVATVDAMRYPAVTLNLANPRVYALADAILRTDIGDKIRITHLPDDYGPDDIDLLVWGMTDAPSASGWRITFICVPASPWEVFVLGDPVRGRLDTSGSELATPAAADDTELLVATDSGRQVWITTAGYPSMFPLAVTMGGELVTVTGITGTTSPQTFTVQRSRNGVMKAHQAGTRVRVARMAAS
ncbi:hypothetical protein [Streptomyces sp. NPDC088789]|uniref:hypothetical protein n=1 Tax=Streptomyces sp. NPDC088789 TaxID=3365899 RepID=UPI00380020D8